MIRINDLPTDLRREVKKHRKGSIEIIDFDRSSGGKGYLVLFHRTGRFGLCINGDTEWGELVDGYHCFPDERYYNVSKWYIAVPTQRWENEEDGSSFSVETKVAIEEAREAGMRWAETVRAEYTPVEYYRQFERFCFNHPAFPDFPYYELHTAAVEGAWEVLEEEAPH